MNEHDGLRELFLSNTDVPRPLAQEEVEMLSQDMPGRTLPSDNHLLGGHDEEPDEAPQRELHDSDAEQRDEAAVSGLRSQERDEQGGRRVLPVDSVPVVRLAFDSTGDVDVPLGACPTCTKDLEANGWCFECRTFPRSSRAVVRQPVRHNTHGKGDCEHDGKCKCQSFAGQMTHG